MYTRFSDPACTNLSAPRYTAHDGLCGQWLESSILHLVEEAISRRVGSEAMLAKLSEALFVDTLRCRIARAAKGLADRGA